jgi:adenylate cyclase
MPDQDTIRRLLAIMSADVVGYSAMMGADEVGTLARMVEVREQYFDPEIAQHGGKIVKLLGDGALVEFSSVVSISAT